MHTIPSIIIDIYSSTQCEPNIVWIWIYLNICIFLRSSIECLVNPSDFIVENSSLLPRKRTIIISGHFLLTFDYFHSKFNKKLCAEGWRVLFIGTRNRFDFFDSWNISFLFLFLLFYSAYCRWSFHFFSFSSLSWATDCILSSSLLSFRFHLCLFLVSFRFLFPYFCCILVWIKRWKLYCRCNKSQIEMKRQ